MKGRASGSPGLPILLEKLETLRAGLVARLVGRRSPPSEVLVMAAKPTNGWEIFEKFAPRLARLILHGPPGTGKTYQAIEACRRRGLVPHYLVLTPETPAAELRGFFAPAGAEFAWRDGPAIAAWREGRPLVIDELDKAGDDVQSFLLALLNDPEHACLTLPTGELVRPAPGFCVFATMNSDPDALAPALRDRFPVCIAIDSVHPAALAALPEDLRGAARATAALPEPRRVSVRAWQAYAMLREEPIDELAAKAVFGARANEVLDALRLQRRPKGGA